MLMYDVTSFETFSALQPLLDQFRRANPACRPAEHVVLVANEARVGMKHAVSPGLALEWCEENGDIPYFEVDPEVPQGVLEPLRFLADEFLTAHPLEQGYPTSGSESDRLKARSMPMRAAPAAAPAAQPHGPSDVGTGGRVLKGALKGTRWSRVSERLGNGLSGGATAAANNGSPSQKVSWTKVLTQVSRS